MLPKSQNAYCLILALTMGALALPVHGAISFDIQSGSNTQTGFTAVTGFPASDGTVSISASSPPNGFRDRGVSVPITGDADADILRDLAFWSTTNPITFTLVGLQANTEYTGTAWVFDNQSGNTGKIIDFTTDGGTITVTTDNTDASGNPYALANFTSSSTGTATVVMDHTGGAGGAVSFVNGFEFAVIPEPTSVAFVLAGLTMLTRRRR